MGLEARDYTVYELLNDRMYSVPSNQRKYVWTQNNWGELLDDLKLILKEKNSDHFIGSVVLTEEKIDDGVKNHYSIIDGQQRISTLTIVLCAISFIFAELGAEGEYRGLKRHLQVKDLKDKSFPIVSIKANKDISKIVTVLYGQVESILESKFPMISVNQLFEHANVKGTIKDCFIYFYGNIKELCNDRVEELERILKAVTRMKYINIIAKNDEDAFTIFEILNARGQPLKDFDLLRNYLLKFSETKNKKETKDALNSIEDLLNVSTEIFLKHYVIHKYGMKTDKNEARPYKVIVSEEKDEENKLLIIKDLLLKALYYNKIINLTDCSEKENKVFSFFKARRQQQFRPLVLGLMHQKELGHLTEESYQNALSFLYDFFVCYNVIGEQNSNKLQDVVRKYSNKLENEFSEQLISEMKKSIFDRIPNEDSFTKSIFNVRYSSGHWKAHNDGKKAQNIRVIFEVIEREFGYTGDLSSDNVTIEHILPDCESEDNTIVGNMMLIEGHLNDACKAKPLSQKIELYKQSKMKLPQLIVKLYESGKDLDIIERTQWIADTLYSYIKKIKEE